MGEIGKSKGITKFSLFHSPSHFPKCYLGADFLKEPCKIPILPPPQKKKKEIYTHLELRQGEVNDWYYQPQANRVRF